MMRWSDGGRGALLAAFCALLVPAAAAAEAAAFPDHTIEVVIHTKYGGGTDTTARMMMIDTSKALGADMVVVSHRGGSGAKAHSYVLDQPADGHTILALTQTHLYTMARGKTKLGIDDIVGVARAMEDPTFIVVGGKSKHKTLADLVAASKDKPLNWGVAQIGGTEHIGLALFAKAAGIKSKAVPFGSGAQTVQALLSGAIEAALPNVSEAGPQIADGSFRPLAVMAEKRLAEYPDVPTTFELGYPVKTATTRGYAVLKGTPQAVIEKISAAMVSAMRQEAFANYLKSAGLNPEDSVAGWQVWDAQLKDEYHKAAAALQELGLLK